jgi:hypothetical protein
MLNYWHRLETLDSTFPILQDAYITSKTLFESKTTSWYGSIHTILEQIPEIKNMDQLCIKLSSFKNKAKIHLKSKFIELWRDQVLQQTNGKLRSYITFRSNFGREKYLSVLKSFEQRRCFTQLRISCHQLRLVDTRVLSYKIENVSVVPLGKQKTNIIFYFTVINLKMTEISYFRR